MNKILKNPYLTASILVRELVNVFDNAAKKNSLIIPICVVERRPLEGRDYSTILVLTAMDVEKSIADFSRQYLEPIAAQWINEIISRGPPSAVAISVYPYNGVEMACNLKLLSDISDEDVTGFGFVLNDPRMPQTPQKRGCSVDFQRDYR